MSFVRFACVLSWVEILDKVERHKYRTYTRITETPNPSTRRTPTQATPKNRVSQIRRTVLAMLGGPVAAESLSPHKMHRRALSAGSSSTTVISSTRTDHQDVAATPEPTHRRLPSAPPSLGECHSEMQLPTGTAPDENVAVKSAFSVRDFFRSSGLFNRHSADAKSSRDFAAFLEAAHGD